MDIARSDIVKFRAVEPDDVDFLYLLENDPTSASYPAPVSREQLWQYAKGNTFDIYGEKQLRLMIDAEMPPVVMPPSVAASTASAGTEAGSTTGAGTEAGNTINTTVGFIEIYDFDAANGRGFVGIAIAPEYRGKGYGRAALDLLCWYADVAICMHQLAAVVAIDNAPSRALFSATFKPAGRLRSWQRRGRKYVDALIFQKLF